MKLTEEELKIIEAVPADKMGSLLDFARFLKDTAKPSAKKRERPRLVGVLKGQVWMSDDFNDPMDFVSESEALVLEAMRAGKKHELEEAVV